MTWFKVDDKLAMHPKVIGAGNVSIGLWVRAGSWSAANGTDGLVPMAVVTALGATRAQADRLVKAGLWHREPDGYRFHDWHMYQPTALDTQLAKEKESQSGTEGNHLRWHVKRGIVNPECPLCGGEQ